MINEDGLKKCYKCQQWLELERFGKNRTRKDGLAAECCECRRPDSSKTKDKMLAKGLKYCGGCEQWLELACFSKSSRCKKDGRLGRCRKCMSVYYLSDEKRLDRKRVDSRIRAKIWREQNKEKADAQSRRWAKENPEKSRAIKAKYRQSDRGKTLQKIHSHNRRARVRDNGAFKITSKEAYKLNHSSCIVCGSTQNIEWDHIIPVSRGGRNSIGNYQPLCRSCNCSKGTKLMAEWRYLDLRKHSQLQR